MANVSFKRLEDEKLAGEIVRKLSDYVNQDRDVSVLVEKIAQEHRTLQQSITVVVLQWLVYLSGLTSQYFDARNQKSVEVAKAILPVLETQNVVFNKRRGEIVVKEAHLPCI